MNLSHNPGLSLNAYLKACI